MEFLTTDAELKRLEDLFDSGHQSLWPHYHILGNVQIIHKGD